MCMSIVYIDSGSEIKEIMRDVIRIDAEDGGFRLVSLLGEEKYVTGRLQSVDFWQEHSVLIKQD